MPQILLPLLLALLTFGTSHARSEQGLQPDIPTKAPADQLVFLNWAEYMDPELLREFERQHNIHVKQIYYESDEHRNALLAESNGRGYDLAIMNDPMISTYKDKGWLAPIPQPQPTNFQHIDPKWGEAFPEASDTAIPLFWGTLGIAYRPDLVAKPITHWSQFFKPDSVLAGRLAMVDSSRAVMGIALKTLGYSLNSTVPAQLKEAATLLKQQRPSVNTYRYISLDATSSLVDGEVIASMMYSGDALMLQELNENIQYVLPEEGGNIWLDYLVVFSASKKQQLAWKFINFLNAPPKCSKACSAPLLFHCQ